MSARRLRDFSELKRPRTRHRGFARVLRSFELSPEEFTEHFRSSARRFNSHQKPVMHLVLLDACIPVVKKVGPKTALRRNLSTAPKKRPDSVQRVQRLPHISSFEFPAELSVKQPLQLLPIPTVLPVREKSAAMFRSKRHFRAHRPKAKLDDSQTVSGWETAEDYGWEHS